MKCPLTYTLFNFIYKAVCRCLCRFLLVSLCYIPINERVYINQPFMCHCRQLNRVQGSSGRMNLVGKVFHQMRDFVWCRRNIFCSGNIDLNGTILSSLVGINFLIKKAVQFLDALLCNAHVLLPCQIQHEIIGGTVSDSFITIF